MTQLIVDFRSIEDLTIEVIEENLQKIEVNKEVECEMQECLYQLSYLKGLDDQISSIDFCLNRETSPIKSPQNHIIQSSWHVTQRIEEIHERMKEFSEHCPYSDKTLDDEQHFGKCSQEFVGVYHGSFWQAHLSSDRLHDIKLMRPIEEVD